MDSKRIVGLAARWFMAGALLSLFAGCGSGSYVKAMINGQEVDLNVDSLQITAGGLGGVSLGYPTGGTNLDIMMYLSSGGYIADYIDITIQNVAAVVLGQPVYLDGNNGNITMTLNGIPGQINAASVIFDSISNVSGHNVSGDFKVDLGGTFSGPVWGHFSGDVAMGY